MSQNKFPLILTLQELKEPLEYAESQIQKVEDQLSKHDFADIVIHGLFALLVTYMETSVIDVLRYFFYRLPHKLNLKETKLTKDELLDKNLVSELLENLIDKKLNELAYKKFDEIIEYFLDSLAINKKPIDQDLIDRILEIKATRNILLHNKLIVNGSYLNKTGNYKRSEKIGNTLPLDKTYLQNSIGFSKKFLGELDSRINEKYSGFSRIRALRELWDFIFSSPRISFDDFWIINIDRDEVLAMKENSIQLSSSEQMFLGMWLTHFLGNTKHIKYFHIRSLDDQNYVKMVYFLSVARNFGVY